MAEILIIFFPITTHAKYNIIREKYDYFYGVIVLINYLGVLRNDTFVKGINVY